MRTQVFAHRGNKNDAPENTLLAFEQAVQMGVDGIETDVHLSADRELVIIHDETVDRTTDRTGLVNQMSLATLKMLNANQTFPKLGRQTIPTLAELVDRLNALNFTGALNLEIKTDHIQYPGIEKMVVDFFASHPHSFTVIYSSFSLLTTKRMVELAPDTEVAGLMIYHYRDLKRMCAAGEIQDYHPEVRVLRCHPLFNRNLNMRPWTVNTHSEMAFCLKRGYAGLITDHPRQALQLRDAIQGR